MIKVSAHKKDVIIMDKYVPNNKVPIYTKQRLKKQTSSDLEFKVKIHRERQR